MNARALVLRVLARMRHGSLTIVEGAHRHELGSGPPHAMVHVASPRAWRALLRGSRGLAESYVDGLWDSPDVVAVIRVAARNAGALDRARQRLTPLRAPYQRVRGALVRNTPRRSRRDISAHYDLGNELFSLMLDPTMMYSSAYFDRDGHDARAGVDRQARAGLLQARSRARRPRAGDRHRLGRLRRLRRRHPRLPRHHDHDLARAARARAGAGRARPA